MTTPIRVIARLDIKGENVIKGVHLEGLRVVGKPAVLAHRYFEQGVDELLYMDAVASLYGRNNLLPIVQEAACDIFVPMTVGGGLRTLDDIKAVLRSGADKIAINTAAIMRPDFLREAAEVFGSQCIVLSVEAIRREPGAWEAMTDNGREKTGRQVLDWVQEAESIGVGEILLTSIDAEGTQKGFDLELIEEVSKRVSVPVIASGGAGGASDVADMITATRSEAVACASVLHYDTCDVPDIKDALASAGHEVRR